ncbi:MAG: hypothetical protein M1840_002655 [Geoglossum simile]|nr:MAG: hypothetical protein M1840_002655 [Geoglossum simile]
MPSTKSACDTSEPQDGLSKLESTNALESSGTNKRKLQYCAPTSIGRRRGSDNISHPVARCQWSTDRTLQLLSKQVEALLVQNSILKERLRREGLSVDDTSQLSTQPGSSAVPSCGECKIGFQRVDNLLRHIRDFHPKLIPYINQVNCVQCNLKFKRPSDLVRHEKFYHKEAYTARIELFSTLELFGEAEENSSSQSTISSSTSAARESASSYSQDEDEHQKMTITTDTPSENPISATHTGQANLDSDLPANGVPHPEGLDSSTGEMACTWEAWVPPNSFHNLGGSYPVDAPDPETAPWHPSGDIDTPNSSHDLGGSHLVDGAPDPETAFWHPSGDIFDIDTLNSFHNLGGNHPVDGAPDPKTAFWRPSGDISDIDTNSFHNLGGSLLVDGAPDPETAFWHPSGDISDIDTNSFHNLGGSHPVDGAPDPKTAFWSPSGGIPDIDTNSFHNLGGSYLDGVPDPETAFWGPSGDIFDIDAFLDMAGGSAGSL